MFEGERLFFIALSDPHGRGLDGDPNPEDKKAVLCCRSLASDSVIWSAPLDVMVRHDDWTCSPQISGVYSADSALLIVAWFAPQHSSALNLGGFDPATGAQRFLHQHHRAGMNPFQPIGLATLGHYFCFVNAFTNSLVVYNLQHLENAGAVPVHISGVDGVPSEEDCDADPDEEALQWNSRAFTTFVAPVLAVLADGRLLVAYGCGYRVCVLLGESMDAILRKQRPDHSFVLYLDRVLDWTSDWTELKECFLDARFYCTVSRTTGDL